MKILLRTLFAAAACACVSLPAIADESENVDQIIVSASRSPLAVNRIGAAITVIERTDIERREARNITDLLRSVPGFAVSQTGVTGSQTQVRVRGAEANHVLVLINGMRATDPATGDEIRWEYLSTASIERIEIVRGSQSALWGSDAIAGVVNIITRSSTAAPALAGYAEAGSFGTTNLGINGSTGDERWSLNGGIERLSTDGSNVSRTGNEDDDSDLTTANVNFRVAASESVSVSAGLRVVDAYSQFDPVDFAVTGLPQDGDVATEGANLYSNAGISIDGGRVRHAIKLRYFESDNDNLVDGIFDSSTASDRTTLTYQADIELGANRLVLAAEHEATNFEQRGAVVFGDPNQDQAMDATSAVIEYQALANERFSWIASARFDSNSDFDDAVNGRLSAAYIANDATTLRFSAGTGRKNPTFTERFGFFPGQFVGNPALEPERSVSFDAGVDYQFADGAGLLQFSLFKQDLKDEINGFVFDPVTFLSTAENEVGTSDRDGAEIAVQWSAGANVGLGMHYTYTDSRDQTAAELRRPKHSGGLSADISSFDDCLSFLLTADYGGERDDIFFPPFPLSSEIVTLDSHWLLDLVLQYRLSDSVQLFAKGTNLLDDDYEQVFGYQTLGRAAYAGLRVNFGN